MIEDIILDIDNKENQHWNEMSQFQAFKLNKPKNNQSISSAIPIRKKIKNDELTSEEQIYLLKGMLVDHIFLAENK